ncbi:MAG TPA: hypothetical protein VNI54_12530 [Thermoanaerobaculia bacterium]|nr:hypothetical protein [Thermoanaerobaculia bacterium]
MAEPQTFLIEGLASLLGGLLGVSIGAWLTGIYKIRGELTGRAEKLDTVLHEVRATAKATEGTKLDTRVEKLDQILQEIKAVTETQKRIEVNITGGEWDRQWRLNQMREAYARLLGALYGLQDYYHEIRALEPYSNNKQYEAEFRAADDLLRKTAAEFKTAAALTRIFAGPPAAFALDQYDKAAQFWAKMQSSEWPKQALKEIADLHKKLLEAARDDLHV